jgi:mannose-1-phosphate guanylyltransferase/mannose-1-phosphate guanylyltransferase/mannose-6-phosphate isomerase
MSEYKTNIYPILLAGGSGTRLWPVSRELYPKQLVKFVGADSLLQITIKRLAPVLDAENIRVVCGKEHFSEIARHMEEVDIRADGKIICEPCGRNTAPAILLGMLSILKHEEDAILCIFPADHVIRNISVFHEKLRFAIKLAEMGYIVTFGIKPHYPETGYGYIEGVGEITDQALFVQRFVEKPDMETARRYVDAGSFFWNSGMFAFKTSVMMNELKIHQPELLKKMKPLVLTEGDISQEDYQLLPNIAIDHAIMEKTDKGAVLPSDFGWSDIGSWKSLYDFFPKDQSSNVIDGDVIAINTENCLIMGNERLVATNNINHIVVVETPDSVFVSDMESSRDVKSIVQKLKEKNRREYYKHQTEYHPWGTSTVLEVKDNFKVVKLIIYPGSKLEIKVGSSVINHLVVIKGQAKTTTENKSGHLNRGQSMMINEKQAVKLKNPGEEPLEIVNVELDSLTH